jgi:glyoxylase-like metal-dependent hydrolase (beta-lactamase superfamily II)/rhodanese-related sulfurtransferase
MPEIIAFEDEGLGNSSYVVDLDDRLLVLDPVRDPRPYLHLARERRAEISFSVETHLHADFVSGSRELAAEGATVVASAASGIAFPHRPLTDGAEVDIGGLTLRALATPGHTPEHLSYLLLDGARELALFSGGALLPGSVARTDLIAPDQTEGLARSLYRSLASRVMTLPDDLVVYPTHGTGATFCAAVEGTPRTTTTIGQEKKTNPLLVASDEDTFVERLLSGYGSFPDYFLHLRDVNARGPRVYGEQPPTLELLPAERVRDLMRRGAEVVDVRPIADFAAGHIRGSLSDELRSAFATWLGWLVERGRDLVFVLNDDQDRSELVRQCLKIGYENIVGEVAGGMAAWSAAGLSASQTDLVPAARLGGAGGRVVDVRQASEFERSHVQGAEHIELGSLGDRSSDLTKGPVVVMCGHGERAMTGASLLERAGNDDVSVILGGPKDVSSKLLA